MSARTNARAARLPLGLSAVVLASGLLGLGGGCGGRPSYWNDPPPTGTVAYGLTNGVALVDDADHRVVMLTIADGSLQASEQSLPIGHNVVSVTVSPDQTLLFVLSAGDWPQRTLSDEPPSMTVIDFVNSSVAEANRYTMTEPRGSLTVDPMGHWAVAYTVENAAVDSNPALKASFVQNPNEIVLFDLTPASRRTVTRTLQSRGGTPQRLVFTPELQLPWNTTSATQERRLLLVESDIDLTMLDADHAFDASPPPEITVPLTSNAANGMPAQQVTTAGVAVDGRTGQQDNARFAVWSSNDTNVYTIQLVAPTTDLRNDFAPTINITDVGGIPSQVAFVETQDPTQASGTSLRVAALVPSQTSAVLVAPDTSLTTTVSLPAPYASMSLVTGLVAPGSAPLGTDVALLWNGGSSGSGAALWSLQNSVTAPYASITTLGATQPVSTALDVPAPNQRLKVLEMSSGTGFYVLDLSSPTAPPLTTTGQATLTISPDGQRLWAYDSGGTDLAQVDLTTLNPVPLTTDLPIAGVFDIQRVDGQRALVALHDVGALGVTVFDGVTPVTATSRRIAPLVLEGP